MTTKHSPAPWVATGREQTIVNSDVGTTLVIMPQGEKGETLETIRT